MKNIIKFLLLLTTITSFSQIEFEKGYFITNDGTKIECLIKNVAWEYNPAEFDYKLSETDESKVAKIGDIKEFNVSNTYKFVRYTTNVNISNLDLERVDLFKDPKLEVKTIFLKVIDEGKATLYEYTAKNKKTYYYSIAPHETAELLIFKEYNFDESTLKENNYYKQQLLTNLISEKLNQSDFVTLKYTKEKLSNLFAKYNNIQSSKGNENYSEKQNQSSINIKALFGLNFVSVDFFANDNVTKKILLKPVLVIGIEAEYIMEFNQNKWSLFSAPNYQKFSIDNTFDNNFKPIVIKYSKIELPMGIRHYLFLDNDSKLFINVGFLLNFKINSTIEFTQANLNGLNNNSIDFYQVKTEFLSGSSLFSGFGYNKKSLSFELRYNFKTHPPVSNQNAYIGVSSIGIHSSYKFL